jgi:uncharacterized membrane protein
MAYKQWSRFEEFPRFMDGVVEIERLDGGRLRWHASICGNDAEWYAQVKEDLPDRRIAWCSEGLAVNAGVVTLQPVGESHTRVNLRIEYDPNAVLRMIGYNLGSGTEQVRNDLECFKEIVEDMAEDAA